MLKENFLQLNFPFIARSPKEMLSVGEKIGSVISKGSVVALKGRLGAGKTCLVKGIAKSLGITSEITSPSYTIITEYEAVTPLADNLKMFLKKDNNMIIPFYHIDVYRLNGEEDFIDLGGEDYINGDGIAVIEWSDKIERLLPDNTLHIEIEILDNNSRAIRLRESK